MDRDNSSVRVVTEWEFAGLVSRPQVKAFYVSTAALVIALIEGVRHGVGTSIVVLGVWAIVAVLTMLLLLGAIRGSRDRQYAADPLQSATVAVLWFFALYLWLYRGVWDGLALFHHFTVIGLLSHVVFFVMGWVQQTAVGEVAGIASDLRKAKLIIVAGGPQRSDSRPGLTTISGHRTDAELARLTKAIDETHERMGDAELRQQMAATFDRAETLVQQVSDVLERHSDTLISPALIPAPAEEIKTALLQLVCLAKAKGKLSPEFLAVFRATFASLARFAKPLEEWTPDETLALAKRLRAVDGRYDLVDGLYPAESRRLAAEFDARWAELQRVGPAPARQSIAG